MSLSKEQVRHAARLARLALTDEEVDRLAPQLSDILGYAEQVGEVATEDVPPTGHPFGLRNVLREDAPAESLPREQALAVAPEAEDERFRVPPILGESSPGEAT